MASYAIIATRFASCLVMLQQKRLIIQKQHAVALTKSTNYNFYFQYTIDFRLKNTTKQGPATDFGQDSHREATKSRRCTPVPINVLLIRSLAASQIYGSLTDLS